MIDVPVFMLGHPRPPIEGLTRAAALLVSLMICACQTTPEPPLPEPEPPPPEPVVDTAAVEARIEALLLAARFAFEDGKVTWPPGDNALEGYNAVLEIDPANEGGQRGLERILEYYVGEAEAAARRDEFARARSMLDRARLINPSHPAITPMARQVYMLSTAIRDAYPLNRAQLTARSSALARRLEALGERARADNARVIIRARTDAEGRWIYQQMRKASGEPRIRAELTIGTPPRVELVELPEP